MTKPFYILLIVAFCGCVNNSQYNIKELASIRIPRFNNGIYSAKIDYYDQETKIFYEYILNVEVFENRVRTIYNLDNDTLLFNKKHSWLLDEFGFCVFSNNKKKYTLNIIEDK